MGRKRLDLIGQRFGRLLVVDNADTGRGKNARFKVLCDCGQTKVVLGYALKRGTTQSCGCFRSELFVESFWKHGYSGTLLYATWKAIKSRCFNPNNPSYKYYGGRGITVCDRWLHSVENYAEDMGERPERMTLGRKDNDGDYEPGNCQWVTRVQQNNNQRPRKVTCG